MFAVFFLFPFASYHSFTAPAPSPCARGTPALLSLGISPGKKFESGVFPFQPLSFSSSAAFPTVKVLTEQSRWWLLPLSALTSAGWIIWG